MASTSTGGATELSPYILDELKHLLWGSDIKFDVFMRWTQGFEFGEDESTALVQHEGGPCAVIAPLQAFLLKNILFSNQAKEDWRVLTDEERNMFLCDSMADTMELVRSTDTYKVVSYRPKEEEENAIAEESESDTNLQHTEDGESSPKKRRFSHEEFHSGLRCMECGSRNELRKCLRDNFTLFTSQYGVLVALYSIVLTKGIDQIKNEVEDPGEALIDGIYGHGSQSLINLLLTGKAVSNVWDNDKDVSGLKLRGIHQQATIGFLTLLEHLRYCEVGWYMKNPEFPIWVVGSETHLTVLFSEERSLVCPETKEATARRIFSSFDTEGSGFISAPLLGDVMTAVDLVSEPEYVKIMNEKMDPEQLGIITINTFMEEFFPDEARSEIPESFILYHYNGLARSCPDQKVLYQEGKAHIMELPELQIITDTSPIKTCLMTKWPTIEIQWKNDIYPSLN